jgi:uncharacterized protein (DUF39 family)
VPIGSAGTLSLVGDIKQMDTRFIRAAVYEKYGVSLLVGIGIPIPVLDEEMLMYTAVKDSEIFTNIYDYSVPSRSRPVIRTVSYAELRSGSIELNGKTVSTAPMSSLKKAREIAELLKQQIKKGEFLLTQPVESIYKENKLNKLDVRGIENEKD